MTRHERCLAAIAGRPVDRAPTYLPGIACAVASDILGRPVHTGTGSLHYAEACAWMKGDAAHTDFEEQLLNDLVALYRALDIDVFRMPWREREKPARQVEAHTFVYGDPNGVHRVCQYNPDSADFGPIGGTYAAAADYETAFRQGVEAQEAHIHSGSLAGVDVSDEHRMLCRRFGDEFFVVCNGGGIHIGWTEDGLCLLASNPDLVRRSVTNQAQQAVALGRALAKRQLPNVLVAGGDLAGNDGPFYSPATFREVMLPPLKTALAELKAVGAHYMFRTDGNLWSVADMLFGEAGCPGYGEVDRDAGMTVAKLRARFPSLVIWGNASVNRLAKQTASEVRDEARAMLAESGGTGYFQGPSNAIMKGTPAQNVAALFAER